MSLDRDLANFPFWLGLGGSKGITVAVVAVVDPAKMKIALGAQPQTFERMFAEAMRREEPMQVE